MGKPASELQASQHFSFGLRVRLALRAAFGAIQNEKVAGVPQGEQVQISLAASSLQASTVPNFVPTTNPY
jgi:hypothetical protein